MYQELRTFFELRFSQGNGWNPGIVIYFLSVLGIFLACVFLKSISLYNRLLAMILVVFGLCPLLIFPFMTHGMAQKLTAAIESNNAEYRKVNGKIRITSRTDNALIMQLEATDYQSVRTIAQRHHHDLPEF